MKNKPFSIKVKGHKLVIKQENADQLVNRSSALGLCEYEDDGSITITFAGTPTKQTIGHELFHAFIRIYVGDYTFTSVDDFEEICCHIIEHNLDHLVELRGEIYEKLQALKDNR